MPKPLKQHSRTLYLRGKGETEAQAVERERKIKRDKKEQGGTESGVVRRLIDEHLPKTNKRV